jgi:hypothetical protein
MGRLFSYTSSCDLQDQDLAKKVWILISNMGGGGCEPLFRSLVVLHAVLRIPEHWIQSSCGWVRFLPNIRMFNLRYKSRNSSRGIQELRYVGVIGNGGGPDLPSFRYRSSDCIG